MITFARNSLIFGGRYRAMTVANGSTTAKQSSCQKCLNVAPPIGDEIDDHLILQDTIDRKRVPVAPKTLSVIE